MEKKELKESIKTLGIKAKNAAYLLANTSENRKNAALEELKKFCWNRNAVWSNGATFDIVVAENAFRQVDIKIPWNFWTIRDTRTLFDIGKVKLSDGGYSTSHKAVEDCERQVAVVQMAYKKLMAVGLGQK